MAVMPAHYLFKEPAKREGVREQVLLLKEDMLYCLEKEPHTNLEALLCLGNISWFKKGAVP